MNLKAKTIMPQLRDPGFINYDTLESGSNTQICRETGFYVNEILDWCLRSPKELDLWLEDHPECNELMKEGFEWLCFANPKNYQVSPAKPGKLKFPSSPF